ncbi:hypothetical protein DEJ27_17130 [Curtobacterium sp. MCPF17_018]|jgi:hypothetical protein|uniref:hypothetical protein n=1 Tax=Curtobacterium sp. MCPF17_018 TaxID=2175638 RepID=UPI000DA81B42|nr:hypothetical protein [Curtobacterium sp. MCPF17_018]PZE63782.1 hypothetical protein DEJ27_17130 [Curtobacterium sp. MCPF17_018]
MRWNTGYDPDNDGELQVAGVEAATARDAVSRLREVVGTETEVLYVLQDPVPAQDDTETYEAFLQDPNAAS